MMQTLAYHSILLHQGGCRMDPLSSSNQEQSTLTHIWAHLSSDLQTCVIGLLAQLALNAVVARCENQSQRKEARHVNPAANRQNPS
ncbi:MAG: hypothetical protein E6J34_14795 [Chloroflexi bacterium]|nr:MAG: hypothetical protein E6J34_14795 [Chloroflexota bacterium]